MPARSSSWRSATSLSNVSIVSVVFVREAFSDSRSASTASAAASTAAENLDHRASASPRADAANALAARTPPGSSAAEPSACVSRGGGS